VLEQFARTKGQISRLLHNLRIFLQNYHLKLSSKSYILTRFRYNIFVLMSNEVKGFIT